MLSLVSHFPVGYPFVEIIVVAPDTKQFWIRSSKKVSFKSLKQRLNTLTIFVGERPFDEIFIKSLTFWGNKRFRVAWFLFSFLIERSIYMFWFLSWLFWIRFWNSEWRSLLTKMLGWSHLFFHIFILFG